MRLDDHGRRTVRRLHKRGIPIPVIAKAMNRTPRYIEEFLGRPGANRMPTMSCLATVKDPEAYMREHDVWYGAA